MKSLLIYLPGNSFSFNSNPNFKYIHVNMWWNSGLLCTYVLNQLSKLLLRTTCRKLWNTKESNKLFLDAFLLRLYIHDRCNLITKNVYKNENIFRTKRLSLILILLSQTLLKKNILADIFMIMFDFHENSPRFPMDLLFSGFLEIPNWIVWDSFWKVSQTYFLETFGIF